MIIMKRSQALISVCANIHIERISEFQALSIDKNAINAEDQ